MEANNIRPWGRYDILLKEDKLKVKKITVIPGGKLSLQYHLYRSEHWVITSGVGVVTKGDDKYDVEGSIPWGMHIFIKQREAHRIENTGTGDLIFIETQIGSYLGEDDIVRIEDIYGR